MHRAKVRLWYILPMAAWVCMQCEKTEELCKCDRYCCLCQSQEGARLCQDGNYYCYDCREACDFRVQN